MPVSSGLPSSDLSLVKRETVEEQIYLKLRREILEGRLVAGERLIQDDLANRLGTSRIPLRGALKLLELNGLLAIDAKGFYSVAHFGPTDLEEICDLRTLLELRAAELALPHIESSDIRRLHELNDAMNSAAAKHDRDQWAELNQAFHIALYTKCGRPRLLRMITDLWHGRPTFSPIKSDEQMLRSVEEHSKMIEAVEAVNAKRLKSLLLEHIRQGNVQWSAYLSRRDGETDSSSQSKERRRASANK